MKPLQGLHIFVRTVELGSISAVAREADVLPSSISRQLSSLEKELGSPLFQRTTRSQSLTEAGRIFYQYASRIDAELEDARLAIQQLSGAPKGKLTLAMEADFSNVFVAPLLPEFFSRYPEIDLKIVLSSQFEDLVTGSIDLAVRMGVLKDSSMRARKLATSHSVLCASPSYIKSVGEITQPSQLSSLNCLSFKVESGTSQWGFSKHNAPTFVEVSGNVKVNSLSFLKQLVVGGLGIAMLPQWMVSQEMVQGTLKPVLPEYSLSPQHTPIYAVYPNYKIMPPKVRAIIDFLIEKMN